MISAAWALSCATPIAAVAQNTGPAMEETTLFEVVVTARRREESIRDTPIAVSAVSAAALENRQIDSVAQVGEFVPNMTFQTGAPTGTGTTPSIFIRGVGSFETSLGTEPGVGLYVDDVYIARSVGSVLDLIDVDSVQVLRGPQGTLFGRNSVGGAVLINSRRPSEELGGSIELRRCAGMGAVASSSAISSFPNNSPSEAASLPPSALSSTERKPRRNSFTPR
jgi:iron complex outermembrane receptor protein